MFPIPFVVYKAVGVLALVTALGAASYHRGAVSGRAEVQAAWAVERAALLSSAVQASEQSRQIENQRARAAQEIETNAQASKQAIRAAADSAVVAGNRLRDRAASLASACRSPAGDTAAAPTSAAAASAGPVLTDVLGQLVETAQQLAAVADERAVAGSACEQAYDSLMR